MKEIWKDIPNYEGLYQASNLGNVRVLDRIVNSGIKNNKTVIRKGKLLKQRINQGYYEVALSKNNKKTFFKVHRLVAITFIPNLNKLPSINHIDENKLNNCVDNLEWCSVEYNCNYGTRNQRIYNKTSFRKGHKPSTCKKVEKYSLDGLLLDTYISIREAGRENNVSASSIYNCCEGKTKCRSYIWKYANE